MTCRMLVAAGNLLIAQNKNEKEGHEYSNDRNFVHGDGWGIVIRKSGKLECYKGKVACWAKHSKAFYPLLSAIADILLK